MPNDNMSFNSIDDLHHFHTTEDPDLLSRQSSAMGDSARFLSGTTKRDAFEPDIGEVFGQPVISTSDDCSTGGGG